MIGKTISHYKILEKLGEGGMGVVYKAQDTKLDRVVALKFLPKHLLCDEEAKTRFVHEAKAASALDHPNVATIYEIDEIEGEFFISMAYIKGKCIKELVKEKEFSIEEILKIAIQIAEGLNAAHKKDIVHRDIKSDNIMVTDDGLAKIMDFGLAKLKGVTKLTKTGTTLGTTHYMSPEQAQGKEVDRRSDIFSFGAVLYEMITGQLSFKSEYEQAVVYSILNEDPEPITALRAGLPMELERIVNKALEKKKEDRYQYVADLGADLRKLRKELEGEALKEQAPTKAQPSIAVLPFVNLSADKEQEYFCDGMAEEIINALTHVESLRVVARTSAFSFRGKEIDIREIGKKLNVGAVLEGSVRKAGNRVRITAQLINVDDGYHLWSEKYDRDMEDIFAIQDEISLAIVDNLKVKLIGEEKAALVRRYTDNLEAYNLYLKGRYHWNKRTPQGLSKAIEHFKKAIEMEPLYALAYTGLADSYSLLEQAWVLSPHESMPKARAAAIKALEIDETLAEAHTSMAFIKSRYDWDWAGAEEEFKHSIQLNPNYATTHHWYAMHLLYVGRFDEARERINRAQELDPLSVSINVAAGTILFSSRRYDRAIEQCRKALDMDPNFGLVHHPIGLCYEQKGMYEETIEEYIKAATSMGILSSGQAVSIREAYAVSGWKGACRKIGDIFKECLKKRYVPASEIALNYIRLGQNEQAFEWLEKAYQERDAWLLYLNTSPVCDNIRSDPRFKALMKKMGLEK